MKLHWVLRFKLYNVIYCKIYEKFDKKYKEICIKVWCMRLIENNKDGVILGAFHLFCKNDTCLGACYIIFGAHVCLSTDLDIWSHDFGACPPLGFI